MKRMNKLLLYGIWLILLLATIIVVSLVYWFVRPYNILTFTEGNGTLVESTVKSGGYLQMRQNRCKHLDYVSEVNRQFIDGIIHQVPPTTNNREVGCYKTIEYVYIPKALPQGEYQIRTVITFSVNPIRKISYTVISDKFTIVK